MRKVYIITEEQKNKLVGKKYADNSFFNPIQDGNGNWIVTTQEINDCEDRLLVAEFQSLTVTDFIPKPTEE